MSKPKENEYRIEKRFNGKVFDYRVEQCLSDGTILEWCVRKILPTMSDAIVWIRLDKEPIIHYNEYGKKIDGEEIDGEEIDG